MHTSHHYSRLEVQTYDSAFHNGNLHAFNSAGVFKHYQHLQLEMKIMQIYTFI